MNQSSDRISCQKCGATNFPTGATCWQCGEALSGPRVQAENETPGEPTPPSPSTPPPPPNYEPSPAVPTNDNTLMLIIIGFVCAALGVICCPIFPVVGIIMGVIVQRRGNPLGVWIIGLSVLFLIVGLAVTGLGIANYLRMMRENPEMFRPS